MLRDGLCVRSVDVEELVDIDPAIVRDVTEVIPVLSHAIVRDQNQLRLDVGIISKAGGSNVPFAPDDPGASEDLFARDSNEAASSDVFGDPSEHASWDVRISGQLDGLQTTGASSGHFAFDAAVDEIESIRSGIMSPWSRSFRYPRPGGGLVAAGLQEEEKFATMTRVIPNPYSLIRLIFRRRVAVRG